MVLRKITGFQLGNALNKNKISEMKSKNKGERE